MKTINGVIFDMDGLIFDTEEIYCQSNMEAAKEYGLKGFDEAHYREEIGLSDEHAYQKYLKDYSDLPKETIDAFFKASRQKANDTFHASGAPLKAGVRELLEYLKEVSVPCVIASSNTTEAIELLLDKADLRPFFKGIVSGNDVTHAKPDPEIIEKAVSLLGTLPNETLMLEDSLNGIRASHTAGVPVIMVPDLLAPCDEALEKVFSVKKDLFDVLTFIKESR